MSNSYCSVPQCSSWAKTNPDLSFHLFPEAGKHRVKVESALGDPTWMCRRKAWILKLKIGKPVTKYMLVCSKHFTDDDFFRRDVNTSGRRRLKWTAIPTQNLPISSVPTVVEPEPEVSQRTKRLNMRNATKTSESIDCECSEEEQPGPVHSHEDLEAAEGLLLLLQEQPNYEGPTTFRDFEVQVNTPKISTLCDLLTTDSALNSFTGIHSFQLLDTIVEAVEMNYTDQRYHRLNIRQRIILLMTKLKCDLSYVTLSILFAVSQELCKKYIFDMLPILSSVLNCAIKFPDGKEVEQNMPICFKGFENVRLVLDCTEIFIQKPKCLCCRIKFYSQYKSNTTVKFMTGVSPGGIITYVSEPYGGRASDKTIFEQSDIILKLDSHKDAIMVDKGFLIDDICETFKIKLIRPPFLKKQSQLTAEQAILNSKIAAARVHIERANQRIKIFKILNSKLQWSLVKKINHIFIIACGLTNLSSPILADCRYLKE